MSRSRVRATLCVSLLIAAASAWIDGGASNDDLSGGAGSDSLRGDNGRDTCISGEVRRSGCEL